MKKLLLILVSTSFLSFGQAINGELYGTVLDPNGAAVPAAPVVVTSEDTGIKRTAQSSPEGLYAVSGLRPGAYRVSVEMSGFKHYQKSKIVLTAGSSVQADLPLVLGNTSERIDVVAEGETIDTSSGTVGQLIDGSQLRDIALNGRNVSQLLMVLPGVVATTDEFDRGGIGFGSFGDFNVNGMRATQMSATVDGGSNQDSGNITSMTNNVGVDFVSEVKVATSGYSAEYGRFSGAQMNFTTRGGGNRYHGTLFEFFRNDKLNARSFFSPTVDTLRLNNFGWNFGGWVPFPGLSSASKKTLFFFAGQEYKRRVDGQTKLATMPTQAERSGIINASATLVYPSNFPDAGLRGKPILDPSRATAPNPTGRNILPRQYMTSNGLAVMKIFDVMEGITSRYTDAPIANNTIFQLSNRDTRREDILRIDYVPVPKHRFTFRHLYDTGSLYTPYETGNIPTFSATRRNRAPNDQLTWSWVSGARVNDLSLTSTYLYLERLPEDSYRLPSTYGLHIKELFGHEMEDYGIPSIAISGYTTISGARINSKSPVYDISLRDSYSWARGKHTLKFGGIFIRNIKNERITGPLPGQFTFNASGNSITSGNALLDTLLGNFRQYTEGSNDNFTYVRFNQLETYIHDDWRASDRLTLNLGIRQQFFGAPWSAYDNLTTFVPEFFDPLRAQKVIAAGPDAGQLEPGIGVPYNGLVIGGNGFPDPGRVPANAVNQTQLFHNLPRSLYSGQNKFSPRLGFAYRADRNGNTVIRSGIAIYYDRLAAGRSVEAGGNPPFTNTVTLFDGKLDDPSSGKASAQFPVSVTSLRPGITAPTTYTWNFGITRKILNSNLDVNYVSTQGRHLLRRPDLNQVTPALQNANRTLNINALRPYQGYTNIRLYESGASSSYHALQAGLTRRYKSSLTYSIAYTWSKVLTDSTADGTEPESNLTFAASVPCLLRPEPCVCRVECVSIAVFPRPPQCPGLCCGRLGYLRSAADAVRPLADAADQHAYGQPPSRCRGTAAVPRPPDLPNVAGRQ
jgi:TonB-dependent Receptor Plug Domain.